MTRIARALGLAVVTFSVGSARAEKPWSVRASTGAGIAKSTGDYDPSFGFNGTFTLDAVFGPTPSVLSIGVHAALSPTVRTEGFDTESMFNRAWDVKVLPLHVGVVAHLGLRGQFWLEPWLGAHHAFHVSECETFYDKRTSPPTTSVTCSSANNSFYTPNLMFTIGVQVGRVVWRHGDQSLSVVGAFARAFGDDESGGNYVSGFEGWWLGAGYAF